MPERALLPGQRCELVVSSRDGSEQRVVLTDTSRVIEAPNWSPDGRSLVFNAEGLLWRVAPEGGTPEPLDSAPAERLNNDHVIAPDGRWHYVSNNDGHLYRLPFDGGRAERLSNTHDPARGYRYYLHGVSPDGTTLAYVGLEKRGAGVMTRICTLPAAGGEDRVLTDGACPVDGPDFGPAGRIWFNSEAAATRPGHAQIFRMEADGSGLTQLTNDARVNWFPHPSPDGTQVVYLSYPPGTEGHPADRDVILRSIAPDGSDRRDLDRFNGGQGTINVPSWAPDSSAFAYVRYPLGEGAAG